MSSRYRPAGEPSATPVLSLSPRLGLLFMARFSWHGFLMGVLSFNRINDSTLNTLMGRVPARCILLLEDLDAAFTRSVTRDANSTGLPTANKNNDSNNNNGTNNNNGNSNNNGNNNGNNGNGTGDNTPDVNTLSLSGLLNSLDGVAAAEGRILFAYVFRHCLESFILLYPRTTNHLERLDPALSRPGRMDVWVEFKNASKWQCEALFRNFFPSSEDFFAASSSVQGSDSGIEVDSDVEIPGLTCETLSSSPSSTSVSFSSEMSSDRAKGKSSPVDPAFPPPTPSKTRSNALDPATLARLAKTFAEAIPEGEFSIAALQGCKLHIFLLRKSSTRLEEC